MEDTNLKQKRVFVLCGPAGVGKSTWAHQHMEPKTDVMISRDAIRFMLLDDEEPYFAVEDKVRKMFFNDIEKYTSDLDYNSVYIDATHLVPKSRSQVLRRVADNTKKIAVSFEAPVRVALERNKYRIGRALVPESVIYNMADNFTIPALREGFDEIWHINADGEIVEKELCI